MAKRSFFYLILVFTVVVNVISCSDENQKQKVDQQYLDSKEYSSFKKNTDREITKNSNSQNLADDLVEISDCSSISNFKTSFSLDWDVLQELTKSVDPCISEKEGRQLTLLGEQSLEPLLVRWYLLEHQSAYRDAEIVVATFMDGELRSFNTVGMYEKIPAHNIRTKILVDGKGEDTILIRTETIRDIKYPIEQKNTITAEYEINSEGGINEL
ncbi:MAG: hypothetical protein GWN00_24640 [Aliifodinibius sp.]|nr:hypothetical protein [Fodinibius sp.]NIV14039.1 hypothetical protein [Fodinibius sp.]NIY27876.1 hypothetical protein [Fodinibius sp.]